MKSAFAIFLAVCAVTSTPASAEPITVDPSNPHYYSFHGKLILLITSAEHYGAVINQDFDYTVYLDALQANGLNYTRIYPGAMFEPIGKFMTGNTLGPRPRSLVVPWARSATPGYMLGGNLFDLDHWDPAYFARLRDFIGKAAARGIAVEICFFNSQYSDTWPISPLFGENNVQRLPACDWRDAQSLNCPELVRREADYVRNITREVNGFDNVILEICDEAAGIGSGIKRAGPWVSRMVDVVRETESGMPQKHLIAQEEEGTPGGPMDFSADPRVPIIVAQYVWGRTEGEIGGDMGGMQTLDTKYNLNKPIEMNETDYYPLGYRGDKIADSRVEAWEFIVGGGAAFNQLNGLFTPGNPSGKSPDDDRLFLSLRSLRSFMQSFQYTRMHPDQAFVLDGFGEGTHYRVLAEAGRQYALYIHHSKRGGSYEVMPGTYYEKLAVSLPAGSYRADWVDPPSGGVLHSATVSHKGGNYVLAPPPYRIDIALRLLSTDSAH